VFLVSLDHFIAVSVVLDLVSSVPSQDTGWEERLQHDLILSVSSGM